MFGFTEWVRIFLLYCVVFTRSIVRLAASLLTKLVDSLAPSITSVLVHGKQVSGKTGTGAWIIDMNNLKLEQVKNKIFNLGFPTNFLMFTDYT